MAQAVTRLKAIREDPYLNLGRDNYYADRGLSWIS
jgi:hypothetical protein